MTRSPQPVSRRHRCARTGRGDREGNDRTRVRGREGSDSEAEAASDDLADSEPDPTLEALVTGTLFVARPPDGWLDERGETGDDATDAESEMESETETESESEMETETETETETESDTETADETETTTETDTGTKTDATDESSQDASQDDLWPIEQLQVEGDAAEDGRPEHLVYGFGQDADGELYVLTTSTSTIEGEGAVHRLVPADETDAAETDDTETDDEEIEEEADDGPEVESEPETEEEAEADSEDDADSTAE